MFGCYDGGMDAEFKKIFVMEWYRGGGKFFGDAFSFLRERARDDVDICVVI